MSINRSNIHKLFLAVSLILALAGFSDLFGPLTSGLGRGFGAVFFSLFMICNYLKNEKTDEELSEEVSAGSVKPETNAPSINLQTARAH
jgi:hypothetical protein